MAVHSVMFYRHSCAPALRCSQVLAYQAARAVWPELAILDPIVGGLTLVLVAHQAGKAVRHTEAKSAKLTHLMARRHYRHYGF